jgi:hypothetical protein
MSTTKRSFGLGAVAAAIVALAAILFSNLEATKGLLVYAQSKGGAPAMIADLILNPAFQVVLVIVALSLGVSALREPHSPRGAVQNPGNDAWVDGLPLEKIYNRKFTNETVALDGRHFINPVFDNVTFFYQGTAPVFFENPTYVLHGGKTATRLASRNKVVTMTMKIHDNLLRANGVAFSAVEFGPDAPLDAPRQIVPAARLEPIKDRTFEKQRIEIDGKSFQNCSFEDVTLVYKGLAACEFTDIRLSGTTELYTNNPAIMLYNHLYQSLLNRPNVTESDFISIDEAGKISRVSKTLGPASTTDGTPKATGD